MSLTSDARKLEEFAKEHAICIAELKEHCQDKEKREVVEEYIKAAFLWLTDKVRKIDSDNARGACSAILSHGYMSIVTTLEKWEQDGEIPQLQGDK